MNGLLRSGSRPTDLHGATRLRASSIVVDFEGLRALEDVHLELEVGETKGLIGPNGAGKTTLLNVLSGFLAPTSGAVHLGDESLLQRAPMWRARAGVVRTFQNVRILPDLTVEENVAVGALGLGASRREAFDRVGELLELIGIEDRRYVLGEALTHGEARTVTLARALATRPRFLLLDEPGAGLNDSEKIELAEMVDKARDQIGCGVLLVDHDMPLVMRLCESVHVLNFGRTLTEASPQEVARDRQVIEAYLGSTAVEVDAERGAEIEGHGESQDE